MISKILSSIKFRILFAAILFLLSANPGFSQTKPWTVPDAAKNARNPIAGDAVSINTGKGLYKTYCTPCHGDKGKGDGIASAGLNPKPANHTSDLIQSETDGSLFYKISEGRNAMPQYKLTLTETQRWSLVNFIRTLAKKS